MPAFEALRLKTPDGLALEARLYRGGAGTPVLCLPGLTRNVRDFEAVAPRLAAGARDVLALSLRGRSGSDYAPDFRTYHPLVYRDDVLAALDQAGIARAIFLGTSLGGIVTMLTNLAAPARVAAAIINDVGPELAPEGIARIIGYAATARAEAANLDAAAEAIRAVNAVAFPGRDAAFWRMFARRTFREETDGSWRVDYDQAIGRALVEGPPPPDLWPAWASLAGKPTLLIRGAISDLLSPAIVAKMRERHAAFDYVEIEGVGHAPTLEEPDAVAAIDRILARPDRRTPLLNRRPTIKALK